MPSRFITPVIAGLSLLLGFTAAQVSGLRWAGAVVVIAGAAWCVWRERRRTPWWRLAIVVVVGALCFAGAHVLSDGLGPWGAVAAASVVLAGVTAALVKPAQTTP